MVAGKYSCAQCKGWGEVACRECGCDCTCKACNGSGLDASLVDVNRYEAAVSEMRERIFADPKRMLGDVDIFDNGNTVGRNGDEHGRVMITDYLWG